MTCEQQLPHHRKPWTLGLTVFALGSFISLYTFFTSVHPLYIFDLDDWLYVTFYRSGLPDIYSWNPIKVLPETLMPLISAIGAYFIYPHTGDYIQSLSIAYTITFSLVIVIYILAAILLIQKRFQLSGNCTFLLAILFLLSHFTPYMTPGTGNSHLFHTGNATCLFNYMIPGLMQFILCVYFLHKEDVPQTEGKSFIKAGFLILLVYLAIFSNLFHSIVLMSLFGVQLLFALLKRIEQNHKASGKLLSFSDLVHYIKTHHPKILAIILWLVSMFFEISGGRAKSFSGSFNLYDSVMYFFSSIRFFNSWFVCFIILINSLALTIAVFHFVKKRNDTFLFIQLKLATCMALTILYLILLAAKVRPIYIRDCHIMISWMGWLMLMTLQSLAYLIKKFPQINLCLPLMTFLLLVEVVLGSGTYAEYFYPYKDATTVKNLGDRIIAQIQEADSAGLDSVQIEIPEELLAWPLDTEMTAERIPLSLYKHRVISRCIKVSIIPESSAERQ